MIALSGQRHAVSVIALAMALLVGACKASPGAQEPQTGMRVSVVDLGEHRSISDPVNIVLRFYNSSPDVVMLPVHELAIEEALFLRLGRRDPIDWVRSAISGHRDSLAPFSDLGRPELIRLSPDESYDLRVCSGSMLPWIYVARDLENQSNYAGKWLLRVGLVLPGTAPDSTNLIYSAISEPVEVVFTEETR